MSPANTDNRRSLSIASSNPDEFSSGMPDEFTGLIARSYYCAWKYPNSKSGKYMLFAAWDIEPDEDSGFQPFTEHYMAGWLNSNVPSATGLDVDEDDREPAGADWDFYLELSKGENVIPEGDEDEYTGPYALGPALSKKTEWAQVLRSLKECKFDGWAPGIDCFEGLRCRFDRMPSDRPKQDVQTGEVPKEYKVLCVTDIVERPKKAGKGATKGAGAGTGKGAGAGAAASKTGAGKKTTKRAPEPEPDDDDQDDQDQDQDDSSDLRARVDAVIVSLLANAKNQTMKKSLIVQPVMREFEPAEKGQVLNIMNAAGFWGSIEGVEYDEKAQTLSLG